MYRQSFLLLFLIYCLTACTADLEPIVVTRVTETAVPTLIITPTPPPPSTIIPTVPTLATATTTVTHTFELPTLIPTATAAMVAPIATPAIPLSQFLATLQEKLNARDFEALKGMMPPRFVLGTHPNQRHNLTANNAVEFLGYGYIPWVEPEIVIHDENILSELTEPYAIETIFKGEQNVTAVVPSSGWGQGGRGDVILYITIQDGHYLWAGLLASPTYYAAPELDSIAPPSGLIYKQGNDLWRVSASGEPQYMTTFSGTLSFNPSGTRALYAETEDDQLTLLHLPEGISETLEIEDTLLHGSWHMPWVDETTAVLLVGSHGELLDQASMGNLATLNVLEGTVRTLPPLLSVYALPSVAVNSGLLYESQDGLYLWQGSQEHIVDFNHTVAFAGVENEITFLFLPVMSPNGRYIIGIHGGEYGRYTWAYVLIDLVNLTSRFIHFFVGVGTDAILPPGIHWSADSQWVALDRPTGDFFANSIQLVSIANPDNSRTLPGVTSNPFWLDGFRLIFKRFLGDQSRWQYMDMMTGEQFWLDLPDGAEVVHYVPQG